MQKIKIIIIALFHATILVGQDTIILKKSEVSRNGFPVKKYSGKVEIIEPDKSIKIITSKFTRRFSFNDVDEVFDILKISGLDPTCFLVTRVIYFVTNSANTRRDKSN